MRMRKRNIQEERIGAVAFVCRRVDQLRGTADVEAGEGAVWTENVKRQADAERG